MSTGLGARVRLVTGTALILLWGAADIRAQASLFACETNNGSLTIIGYLGPGGAVQIPAQLDGLPVIEIGIRAFFERGDLTAITIPEGVVSIGGEAFLGCSNLVNVTVPDSVTNLGWSAFCWCPGLTEFVIGDAVQGAGYNLFAGCTALGRVQIGRQLDALQPMTFKGCTALTNVALGEGVITIMQEAFMFCPALGEVIVPDRVASLGEMAFAGCTGLGRVVIGNGVTNIGSGAFYFCSGLTNLVLGDQLRQIEGLAFQYCTALREVRIPDSVVNLGPGAFDSCASLTNVIIGESLSSMGWNVFAGVTNFLTACFEGNAPVLTGEEGAFGNSTEARVFYRPGTVGWGPVFAGRPTSPWWQPRPLILKTQPGLGPNGTGFDCVVSWATNAIVVVETSPFAEGSPWTPVATNALKNGFWNFTVPTQGAASRFYRARSE